MAIYRNIHAGWELHIILRPLSGYPKFWWIVKELKEVFELEEF